MTLFTASTIFVTLLSIRIAWHYREKARNHKVTIAWLEESLKNNTHGKKWYKERLEVVEKKLQASRLEALESKKRLEKLIGRE